MKLISAAHELISNMRTFFQSNSKLSYLNEEPLRGELYSSEQMERFGIALAKTHKITNQPEHDHLLKRLANNEMILHEVRKLLTDSIKRKTQIPPAGEWLIDNFYLIEENIRSAKMHLPKDYSEDLPQLANGSTPGLVRIYDIVLRIISHNDGRIDQEGLSSFIRAYQSVTNLQLGELWAIPIMLRLGLIENLRRVSARVAIDRLDANLADYWARQMLETAEKQPKNMILVIADMARSNPPMGSSFVSEITRQLRGKGPDLALALNWIELQLSDNGLTSTELVNSEIQKQAADQVSMSNSIGSLRFLGSMDWRDFVEKHSVVEQILCEDKLGIYPSMDFSTRDQYRHVIEDIAKKSKLSEQDVARIAIDLSYNPVTPEEMDERVSHVGYYLIGKGQEETKRRAKMHESFGARLQKRFKKHTLRIYLTAIFLISAAISGLIFLKSYSDTNNPWLLVPIALLSLLCTSQMAISIVNFFSTIIVKPKLLPKMDFSEKIPEYCRTMVVVPVILNNSNEIERMVEALEVRFLANRNEFLHFGLLTDFKDATQEKLPEDDELIKQVKICIEQLNKKYGRDNDDLFYLFHRPRYWNPKQGVWMGYERKRGKLGALNAMLRGSKEEHFSVTVGDLTILPEIKYVITLDADTQLPMGSAWKLVATMAHPLNHAFYDERKKRVTKGYGILQPRVNLNLPEAESSLYTRMNTSDSGIDPYTRASSDVYQDLFAEGSFIGKGIYDVDIFIKTLEGRFAENCILSHDLLEGCYVRSGLLSDVYLFEKYPNSYRIDMKRFYRWIRGDWQIFTWFLPFIKSPLKHWQKNPLSALSRWKIFDNIRRSLIPIALTTLLLLVWATMPSSFFWTITVTGMIAAPIVITSLWDIIKKPKDVALLYHIHNSINNTLDMLGKTLFAFICFPYEAHSNLKAILRTLWRMFITKRKLLEWNPFANEERSNPTTLKAYYRTMWSEPFLALAVFVYLGIFAPLKLIMALPILVLWFNAPFIAWWISQPVPNKMAELKDKQNIFLRKIARKTWSFFEQFIRQEDNWLPPDNYQEQPVAVLARRTSPTNIGLSLLASVTAWEFGYITIGQLLERTGNTLNTMNKMERYKGHLYNWYGTESLNPLMPKYISSVDSGNLAGHLLVLKQGMLTLPHQDIFGKKIFEGLQDTLNVLSDTISGKDVELLLPFITELEDACTMSVITFQEVKTRMDKLTKNFLGAIEKITAAGNETNRWKQALLKQIDHVNKELNLYAPWFMLNSVPSKFTDLTISQKTNSLSQVLKAAIELRAMANRYESKENAASETKWLEAFQAALTKTILLADERIIAAETLAEKANALADMEWDFLYNKTSNLLTIGYNVQDHHMDGSYYDLLASEARLCAFVCIAQGKLPEESWFSLGRLLINVGGKPILLSWSGSMFEYLMPLLVMPTYENTLLDQTCKAAVDWQIKYGKQIDLPWGISESGYNMINASSDYQYKAFGAPGLGLKRGLEEDTVIAPYAAAMSLMVAPEEACKNLQVMSEKGYEGRYGFYEAVDYTPSRVQRGQTNAIVYSFMAHHQGMSLLSLAYVLLNKPMQKLFEAEPQFQASLLLLQERIPKATSFFTHTANIADINYAPSGTDTRIVKTPNTPIPEVQLLSNGRYHVMVTNSGGGYSRWKGLAVTRWREDVTCDNYGSFLYIRDMKEDNYWSNTYQPTLQQGEKYEAAFTQGRVDFRSTHNDLESHTEILVSPEDDIEMRRVCLTNRSNMRRTIEVTSYAEVVINAPAADIATPAFSNLFVQTEILSGQHAILCTRRPRSADEQPPSLFHLLTVHGATPDEVSYETDRMKFIGRGNTTSNPQAMSNTGKLTGSEGSVLDPIVAIRYKITLDPEESVTFDMIIGMADTREVCLGLIDKYQDKHHKDRVFELAWTHSQVVLRQINATETDAQLYARIASSILFTNSFFRADPLILINNRRGQSGLWGYSISGDLPIVLLKIEKQSSLYLVKQLVQAHSYWRLKGIAVDLMIWNEEHTGYRQVFQNEVQAMIPVELNDKPGGIFVRASDQISNEDRVLFQTVARIIFSDKDGSLEDQVKRKRMSKATIPYLIPTQTYRPVPANVQVPKDLVFFNGLGGFTPNGSEYVIHIKDRKTTPAPWVNVIANPTFGTVLSESGVAYTWTENAYELRLTPWNNDPVSDLGGEAYYLRDEETGHFWSTTFLPSGGQSSYLTRHGFGYSVFEHIEDGIHSEMTVFVDLEESIKFVIVKIKNQSGRPRKLSATGYTEWVLGNHRMKTAMYIQTEVDADTGAILAKNPYNTEFGNRVGFFDVNHYKKSYTADRTEFIGRNGSLKNPDGLLRQKFSGKTGLAIDPCAALQVLFDLEDGGEHEIVFKLGAGRDHGHASELARKFKANNIAYESLEKVKNHWKHTVSAIQVETPDQAVNFITNGWLTYQTLSSRLWGRSGYYQSGGAFGYRDQLQDVVSLLHTAPELARKQILLCASRQFVDGDAQHWWHPPVGRGVRTLCSDDFLWLPFVTSLYIAHTGDTTILEETASFLEGRQLNAGEESYYDLPIQSSKVGTVYEHCVIAIRHGLVFGEHGLPLIGSGDWNDGFDRVGIHGKGESVWMAFFLYLILEQFAKVARAHKDPGFADECMKAAQLLKSNVDEHAWDGEWYKRAWFDNGAQLGSSANDECRIDSIAQSWSVLSGAGDPKRSLIAMESAYKNLVRKDSQIIQLLDPPFDKSQMNPGYIKGYVPGVRENGGQYTHAAVWLITAFAKLGDRKRVWELLSMINPLNHGKTAEDVSIYRVEPYVLAADVYARKPHIGRGGWTWYTGSASWMYRLITESFLGIEREGNQLRIIPCVPKEWQSYKIHYRFKNTYYHIEVVQNESKGETLISLDNHEEKSDVINMVDDGKEHQVKITIYTGEKLKPHTVI
ncbi:MAG TPA: glucoamylase family protein [Cytophagaceae bacterium]|nr:glucoamylase family protein [Cytophagaceae bacterium]